MQRVKHGLKVSLFVQYHLTAQHLNNDNAGLSVANDKVGGKNKYIHYHMHVFIFDIYQPLLTPHLCFSCNPSHLILS